MKTALAGQDILSISDLKKTDIQLILRIAAELKKKPAPQLLAGKILGSCFFEPSTRTRLSFESAMLRLGGSNTGFADPLVTSVKKGETLADTIKIIGAYVDVIAIRHPLEGAARLAAEATTVPIINAGDGANQHPTQTILDLFTIQECQKKLTGLEIALVGDLKHGRTVHSLAQALMHFDARLYLVAPPALQLHDHIATELKQHGLKFSYHETMDEIIPKIDILYMTRIQQERFTDKLEFERLKHTFTLHPKQLKRARKNLRILHPLPRIQEIDPAVDSTPFAYYFAQAANGLYVREAILGLVLGKL